MKKVFITYSRESEGPTKNIVEYLKALGCTVWLDEELNGGQSWWDKILDEVRYCEVLVFALTPLVRVLMSVCRFDHAGCTQHRQNNAAG